MDRSCFPKELINENGIHPFVACQIYISEEKYFLLQYIACVLTFELISPKNIFGCHSTLILSNKITSEKEMNISSVCEITSFISVFLFNSLLKRFLSQHGNIMKNY